MLILGDPRFEQDGLVVIVFDEFLHLCWKVFEVITPDCLYTHTFCKLDKVRVVHLGMGVALFVEKILPLDDHSLELVVEDEDFDSNIVLCGSSKFHGGHAEGCVTVDVNDDLLWCGNFGSDTGGETEAHGT